MSIIRKINNLTREVNILKAKLCKGGDAINGAIPDAPLNVYNTHAEAIADVTLTSGSFYVLSTSNLEGVASIEQGGPFFRKN